MSRIKPRTLDNRIKAVKTELDILQVAAHIGTTLTKRGARWRGQCPLCGSGERSNAFSVDADLGLFHCHSCGSGGDLVRLVELYGPFSVAEAVAWLGREFNVDLPARPDSWFSKQDRQARLREQLARERAEIKRRRLFKYFVLPELEKIPEVDRAEETRVAWERMKKISYHLLGDTHG